VPASGRFTWHVNPSLRPSQYASAHLDEAWTITCGPGNSGAKRTLEVTVARGGTAFADMSRYPHGPKVE
jgi:carboxypeptidase T